MAGVMRYTGQRDKEAKPSICCGKKKQQQLLGIAVGLGKRIPLGPRTGLGIDYIA